MCSPVSFHHFVFRLMALLRILFAWELSSFCEILIASFTFLAATTVFVRHHPASIYRISLAVPWGACSIVLKALRRTMSACFRMLSPVVPEVISSPYRKVASMHAVAIVSLWSTGRFSSLLLMFWTILSAFLAFCNLVLGWSPFSFALFWNPRYLMFSWGWTLEPASLIG